jgi:hypothetical protein
MTTFTGVEDETESKVPHEIVMATASVMPKLSGHAIWRQETNAWWIKRPSGVWTVEDNEQVGSGITAELMKTRPGKLTPQLVRNVKQFLQWGALSVQRRPSTVTRGCSASTTASQTFVPATWSMTTPSTT